MVELWKTYPRLTDTKSLTLYYRKQNQTVPIVYLWFILIQFFMQSVRACLLLSTQSLSKSFLWKLLPVFIYSTVSHIFIAIYIFNQKARCKEKSQRDNFKLQYFVRQKMHLCTINSFISYILFAYIAATENISSEPLELTWIVCFLMQLFCCVWFSEGLLLKILMLAAFNMTFCLIVSSNEAFKEALSSKIAVPILFSVAFLVAHDRSIKINFVLKQLMKEQKTVYEDFLQKIQDPIVILDKEHLVFHNEAATKTVGNDADTFYRKADLILNEHGETLEISVKERLYRAGVSPSPIKQDRYYTESISIRSSGSKCTLAITLIESAFFARDKTVAIIIRDITNELLTEQKRLEDKYKNMMLFSLSHELRTPLNILQSVFRLLKSFKKTPEQEAEYKVAKGAWHYLRNKINDTLVYAQYLMEEFALHCSSFPIREFANRLLKVTTFLLQRKRQSIKLAFDVCEGIPENIC